MSKDLKTIVRDRATEIALSYESRFSNRFPVLIDKKGVGYDIKSENKREQRYIEVKGVSEDWKSYIWQSLYASEVKCLQENPDKFYLYIVYFDLKGKERTEKEIKEAPYNLYIISGKELLNKNEFKIQPDSFSLTPISRRKLDKYKASTEPNHLPSFVSTEEKIDKKTMEYVAEHHPRAYKQFTKTVNCKHQWELIESGKSVYGENNGYLGIISDFRCKKCGRGFREFLDGYNF